jgi:hypothetical protein
MSHLVVRLSPYCQYNTIELFRRRKWRLRIKRHGRRRGWWEWRAIGFCNCVALIYQDTGNNYHCFENKNKLRLRTFVWNCLLNMTRSVSVRTRMTEPLSVTGQQASGNTAIRCHWLSPHALKYWVCSNFVAIVSSVRCSSSSAGWPTTRATGATFEFTLWSRSTGFGRPVVALYSFLFPIRNKAI